MNKLIEMMKKMKTTLMIAAVFNFGPQHPATHGVLRLISLLHGELIQ